MSAADFDMSPSVVEPKLRVRRFDPEHPDVERYIPVDPSFVLQTADDCRGGFVAVYNGSHFVGWLDIR